MRAWCPLLVAAAVTAGAQNPPDPALRIPPPASRFQMASPLPTLPGVLMDVLGNAIGEAQQTARAQGLQGRMLWVDATANVSRVDTDEKIAALVQKAKDVGFNTIVFDIKPISGHTMYPSKFAPKLREWKGNVLPEEYDPLAAMVRECRSRGMLLYVSLNAFSEGHRDFKVGLGYEHVDWQTVLYEPKPFVRSSFPTRPRFEVQDLPNGTPDAAGTELSVLTDASRLPAKIAEEAAAAVVDGRGRVLALGGATEMRLLAPTVPSGGSVVWGTGPAAEFLRLYAQPGDTLEFDHEPLYVPIQERPRQQIPLMVNPLNPEVQDRALAILGEVLANYEVEGVLYDDRLRFGGLNADFSESTRRAFEEYVGASVNWPDDVYRHVVHPDLSRGVRPGKYLETWLVFRALGMRNFVARARAAVDATRPGTLFGVYAGSWFGEYSAIGANWSSTSFDAGFWFLSDAFRKTGYAPLVDLMITGCYYKRATIAEAMEADAALGYTVEAAGQLSNRAVRDAAWTYAGIMLMDYKDDPGQLRKVLQAACGSTQGVMVFDLSHDIDMFWPILAEAFRQPARAPTSVPGLLAQVRKKRAALDAAGARDWAVPILPGMAGAGF